MNDMSVFEKIKDKNVMVVGDIFMNENIRGSMYSLSEESPIPIVHSKQRSQEPGGAAHVAVLLKNFGCHVMLAGFVGDDANGHELLRQISKQGINTDIIMQDKSVFTNCQTRISVKGAHYPDHDILRIDTPGNQNIPQILQEKILSKIKKYSAKMDALVVMDKTECFIHKEFIQAVKSFFDGKICIGDSEKQLGLFAGFTAVTPNEQESRTVVEQDEDNIEKLGKTLQKKLKCDHVFLTCGSEGIYVFQTENYYHVPTRTFKIFDVTGAGETVVASVTAGLLAQIDAQEIARFTNTTAGVAVSRPGLVSVTVQDVIEQEKQLDVEVLAEKLVTPAQLKTITTRLKAAGKKVVWTNGCYDIMHVGHILYLEKARSLGDVMVVGLNSDASVRAFKGPLRPIVQESQRAKLLSAMTCVDYVVIFDEPSPMKLIELIEPDIFAKGGDYTLDSLNQKERKLVEGYGGEIALLAGIDGMSTSNIISKILKAYKE